MDKICESSESVAANSVQKKEDTIQIFPAADAQQRLWFIDQLLPSSPVYNIYRAIRIEGELNSQALHSAINGMIERHESLRTTFDVVKGKVVQKIHPLLKIDMPFSDLSETPEKLQPLLDSNIQMPFDLVNGPVVRIHLIKCEENNHIFHFMVHHNAFDRRSLGLLNLEITELYKYYNTGEKPELPALSIQFSDYSLWRLDKHKTEDLSQSWKYWQKQLANVVPMSLPYDKQRSIELNSDGDRIYLELDKELIQKFETMAKKQGMTMFIALLSVFKTLIHRWSGETDILAGTPFADRRLKETDDLFGFFVSTLVLRSDLSGDPTFRELLSRVRKSCFNSYRYNSMPLDTIIEKLNPARETNRNPLFDMEFQVQMLQPESLQIGDTKLSEVRAQRRSSQYDLSMTIREKTDGYDMRFEYRSDLFEAETIHLLLKRFHLLLEAIVENPDQPLSSYSIVLPEEREKILVEWNKTAKNYATDQCLHQIFERQVVVHPDKIALDFEGNELSYGELNEKANQLAGYLRKNGVTAETKVGVCMERSLEMVISLYGILKAGGGYVPLDPDYPEARLAFMLEDIAAPIILTQKHLTTVIPDTDAKIIALDECWDDIQEFSVENPELVNTPNSLAYIIYTSGSTGNPKGVMNQHSGIINRLIWMQEEYQLTAQDVVLQKTPYSFDVSVWEFFWPLIFGAKLVVAKPGGHQDVRYMADLIETKSITTMHFVPSMLQIFVDHADSKSCETIRQIFCSGEALPYELQKQFFSFSNSKLHNLYGPTEAAVDVTYWECDPNYGKKIVPIGRPVANTKILILDKNLNPIPVGSAGELHIGGIQVARGYLNRDELTAEKFIDDPYSNDPKAKLYKTGDLVRHLSDGQIEYLGRIDFQVKIRGLRIELGEIESRLAEIEGIKQCVVIVREDKPGDKKIVAYIETKDDALVTSDDMRQVLGLGLPNYMVPQVFVEMESLPLSPNGKIERKALPEPSTDDLDTAADYVEPISKVEKQIAEMWTSLLGVENIGVYDKFIELGGHSMLVLEAVWKAKEDYGLELDPASLIRDTLEQIAASVEGENAVRREVDESQKAITYEPYYFGPDDSLFGMYQWPTRENRGAVLLCSPIYLESLNTHLTYRYLSAKLSQAGFHVLRFDYYAAGDSLGDDEEAHVNRWKQDIKSAVDELQIRSGFDEISMIGFRFGATLASLALPDNVDKLILWEPVISGQAYVEQLISKYISTLGHLNYIRKNEAKAGKNEIIGFNFPDDSRKSIESANLFDSEKLKDCRKIITITSNSGAEVNSFAKQLDDIPTNTEFHFVEDSIEPIETYTDMMVYLPGKSLNVLVAKMKGE
ncbi:MAG: amino acid adenylation domain-containing protein [Kangiellaceae bacterium]|nr:amino acid adenylation domain-containing protein [Kangiellaceae bacterium]